MQETRNQAGAGTSVAESPVDDATYNVLQALTSKLEAIEAYELYAEQDDSGVFAELIDDERRHAERLLQRPQGAARQPADLAAEHVEAGPRWAGFARWNVRASADERGLLLGNARLINGLLGGDLGGRHRRRAGSRSPGRS